MCVYERQRERERESVCVCVRDRVRERECVCVCVRDRVREKESVCVMLQKLCIVALLFGQTIFKLCSSRKKNNELKRCKINTQHS